MQAMIVIVRVMNKNYLQRFNFATFCRRKYVERSLGPILASSLLLSYCGKCLVVSYLCLPAAAPHEGAGHAVEEVQDLDEGHARHAKK